MKVISVNRGFTADHSSTSYEFLAVDRLLSQEERSKVASLSRRAQPTSRKVSFIYHADGYDIPGGWEPLMRDYYDVMFSESYDWWLLAMAFDAAPEQQAAIGEYEFDGIEDMGVDITFYGTRTIVTIHCRLDMEIAHDIELFPLLTDIRRQLVEGDYRALYAVWEEYGYETEDSRDKEPPEPPHKDTGEDLVETLYSMLAEP
ncbi:MAG: hypothetical protein PHT33_00395 [bacterium]|nr:hypothetical protein [bacterium]